MNSKHSPNLLYSWFHHDCHSDLLASSSSIWILPHFQMIHYLSLYLPYHYDAKINLVRFQLCISTQQNYSILDTFWHSEKFRTKIRYRLVGRQLLLQKWWAGKYKYSLNIARIAASILASHSRGPGSSFGLAIGYRQTSVLQRNMLKPHPPTSVPITSPNITLSSDAV
jgi:hypothetical protein